MLAVYLRFSFVIYVYKLKNERMNMQYKQYRKQLLRFQEATDFIRNLTASFI
jgi:hypothetical protein